jgi:hypothetical protein
LAGGRLGAVGPVDVGRIDAELIVEAHFDRDTLLLPDILVEDLGEDVGRLFRPAFDAVWQASGWSRCHHYDAEGKRIK